MDPVGTFVSIAAICIYLQELSGAFVEAPSTIVAITAQIKVVETGIRRIQEWLHSTDPKGKAQVEDSIQAAIATVDASLDSLKWTLDSVFYTGPKTSRMLGRQGSDMWVHTKFAFNEPKLVKHLTDLSQCTLLLSFTLSVCQLPTSPSNVHAVKELGTSARTLSRAHKSTRSRRRCMLSDAETEAREDQSANFKVFIQGVLDAEKDLPQEIPKYESADSVPFVTASPLARRSISSAEDLALLDGGPRNELSKAQEFSEAHGGRQMLRQDGEESSYAHSQPIRVPSERTLSDTTVLTTNTLLSSDEVSELTRSHTEVTPNSTGQRTIPRKPVGSSRDSTLDSHASQVSSLEKTMAVAIHSSPDEETISSIDPGRDANQSQLMLSPGPSRLHDPDGAKEAWADNPPPYSPPISEQTSEPALHVDTQSAFAIIDHEDEPKESGRANSEPTMTDTNDSSAPDQSSLQLAVRAGDDEMIARLLESIPRKKKKNNQAIVKAFYESVGCGHAAIARRFLDTYVDIKAVKEQAILLAAQGGHLQMFDLLVPKKSDLKATDSEGLTALHHAAKNGNVEMVEHLLSIGTPWKTQTKRRKETALHLATSLRQTSAALALIPHQNAKLSVADVDGQEAIHHAIRVGDIAIVRALLQQDIKLKSHNDYGWSPIHLAAAYSDAMLMAELITHGADLEDRLEGAKGSFKTNKTTNEGAQRGYWAEIRWPHEDARALHLAIEFGNLDVARQLLASGAKHDATDDQRWQPLHYAAFYCKPDIIQKLIDLGASPHAVTSDGNTPLELSFLGHGREASPDDQGRVKELLQAASVMPRKSSMTNMFRKKSASSRTAKERDQAWHMAGMAESLVRDRSGDETAVVKVE